MKHKFSFPIIVITALACSLTLFACEGPAGPQGSQGPQGEPGPQGPVGPAGDGGAVMLAGQGVPSQNTGNPGDFYIDLDAGNLYGPKTGSGWGSFLNLQGPPGTANVRYSPWISVEWDVEETHYKLMVVEEPNIDHEFIDTGLMAVYIRSGVVFQVPVVYGNDAYRYSPFSGGINGFNFEVEAIDYSKPLTGAANLELRYVLVPGGFPLKIEKSFWEDYVAVA